MVTVITVEERKRDSSYSNCKRIVQVILVVVSNKVETVKFLEENSVSDAT